MKQQHQLKSGRKEQVEDTEDYKLLGNKEKLKFRDPVTIYDYCNQLGDEGWELSCISEVGDIMRFIFKRPKE